MSDQGLFGKINRRNFIKYSAIAGAAAYVALSPEHLVLQALTPGSTGSSQAATSGAQETLIRTMDSPNCAGYCGYNAHVVSGRVVKMSPASFPSEYDLTRNCLRGLTLPLRLYSADRIKSPMKRVGNRGGGQWQTIGWDQAFSEISNQIKSIQAKYGAKSVAFWSGSGTYGAIGGSASAALANLLGATNLTWAVDTGYASGAADMLGPAVGPFGSGSDMMDFLNSRTIVLWGAGNLNYTKLPIFHYITYAKEQGAQLITIDPRFTVSAQESDWWIPIRPGTDGALALSIANEIINANAYDSQYLLQHTVAPFLVRMDNNLFLRTTDVMGSNAAKDYMVWDNNAGQASPLASATAPTLTGEFEVNGIRVKTAFSLLADLGAQYPPDVASGLTDVSAQDIQKLAAIYSTKKPSAIITQRGLDRWYHSDLMTRAQIILAMLTGQIGTPGGGISLYPGPSTNYFLNFSKLTNQTKTLATSLSTGYFYNAVLEGKPYEIRALISNKSNTFNQVFTNMNKLLNEVLPKLELVVTVDYFGTTTVQYSDYILPAATLFEHVDVVTGGYGGPWIQLQPKIVDPLYDSKPDFDIYAGLASALGLTNVFTNTAEEYIDMALKASNGSQTYSYDMLTQQGVLRPTNIPATPFVWFENLQFGTPSGRIEFYVERCIPWGQQLPLHIEPDEASPSNPLFQKYPLIFLQTHSKWRTHSTYANTPWLLEINPYPVVTINTNDASTRGIKNGDVVEIYNDRGHAVVHARLDNGIKPGVVDLPEGWWKDQFIAGSFQELTNDSVNPELRNGPNFATNDCLVEIRKWSG